MLRFLMLTLVRRRVARMLSRTTMSPAVTRTLLTLVVLWLDTATSRGRKKYTAYNETPTLRRHMSIFLKIIKIVGLSYAMLFLMLLGILIMTNVMFWTLT